MAREQVGQRGSGGPSFPVLRFEAAFLGNVEQDFGITAPASRVKYLCYVRSVVSIEAQLREDRG